MTGGVTWRHIGVTWRHIGSRYHILNINIDNRRHSPTPDLIGFAMDPTSRIFDVLLGCRKVGMPHCLFDELRRCAIGSDARPVGMSQHMGTHFLVDGCLGSDFCDTSPDGGSRNVDRALTLEVFVEQPDHVGIPQRDDANPSLRFGTPLFTVGVDGLDPDLFLLLSQPARAQMCEFISAHPSVEQRLDDQLMFVAHRRCLLAQNLCFEVFQWFALPSCHIETRSLLLFQSVDGKDCRIASDVDIRQFESMCDDA